MDIAYSRSASVYDAIYQTGSGKDYASEADQVHAVIVERKRSVGNRLLDVGCGTGSHISPFARHYEVEGLDRSAAMLDLARAKSPTVKFHQADMTEFELGQRFDAVVCLFSGIGYVRTAENLRRTVKRFFDHVVPGGVVVVDGWYAPDQWHDGSLHATLVDEPDLKVARICRSTREGKLSLMECHHIVAKPSGVEYFVEHHALGLFTADEYCEAFHQAGLILTHDPDGADGRGRYIGVRPA
jgi:SAM-dependent methyltransferase